MSGRFSVLDEKNWRLGEMIVGQSTPVILVGLITPFTLMAKLSQGSSQFAGIAQLIRALAFQAGGCGFESHYLLKGKEIFLQSFIQDSFNNG